jgi:tetratricopeptide (TPR) repeat protein
MTRDASNTSPAKARKRESGENTKRPSTRKHEESESAKRTAKTRPSSGAQSVSSGRISRPSLFSRYRVNKTSRFRLFRAFTSSLLLALLAMAAGGWFRHWRAESAAASAWQRPESAEERRLLTAALKRPAEESAQASLGRYYLAAGRPFEALWALQRARDATGESRSPSPGFKASPGLKPRSVLTKPAFAGSAAGQLTKVGFARTDRGFNPGLNPGLAMAETLESVGLRARALALLTEAVAHHPADVSLALRQAELQLRLGQPAAAVAALRPFASQPPTPTAALLFGRALEANGDDAAALAQYRGGAAAAPGSVEAHLRLGRLLVRRGQVAEGRAALEAAHRLAPADPEPCYALGMSFMPEVLKNPLPAVRWLSETLRVAPGYAPAHVALGRVCMVHRRWVDAARQLERVQSEGVSEPAALRGLAEVLAANRQPLEARQRRGMADVLEGKLSQALDEFRALKAVEPGSRDASILISQVLIQMGRSAEAAVEIQAAADRWPRDAELKERLAQLYIDSLTHDGARQLCEQWRRQEPAAAKPLWLLGRAELFSPHQLPQAIDHLERAARLAPRDPEILFALGEALSRSTARQDTGRALDLLGRAIELAPREAKYRYQMGLLLQQLDRPVEARRQYLRALDLNPRMTAAYAGLLGIASQLREPGQIALFAPVIRDQQQAKRAESELRRSTYRSPQDPAAYAALARYLSGRGDLRQAQAQWEVVLTLNPNDAAARQELARLDRILAVL